MKFFTFPQTFDYNNKCVEVNTLPGMNMDELEIVPVNEENHVVMANLSKLYTYDVSEFASELNGYECDEDGEYSECVQKYLQDHSYDCFLIKVSGEWAGFTIVEKRNNTTHSSTTIENFEIAEFFLARKFRRKGVATNAAHRIFDLYTGKWEVNVWPENLAACAFWKVAISKYTANAESLNRAYNSNFGCEMITYTF